MMVWHVAHAEDVDLAQGMVMDRQLRIGFLTSEYVTEHVNQGGLANYVHRISRALAERGHEVHVFASSIHAPAEIMHGPVHVHRVYCAGRVDRLNKLTAGRLKRVLWSGTLALRMYQRFKALHEQKPFDLIQVPNLGSPGLLIQHRMQVPVVARISSHSRMWSDAQGVRRSLDGKWAQRMEAWSLKKADRVIGPSKVVADAVERDYGVKNIQRVRTPFYMETPELDGSVYERDLAGKAYALYFGRLQLHKGMAELGEAIEPFLRAYPEAHMVCVGKDMATPLAESTADYLRDKAGPYADRFIHIPAQMHPTLYPIIQNARFIVLPSLVDNLPNTMLEAMGLGKVVIGTRGASFDEVITDGHDGFLVNNRDAQDLARTMIDVWKRDDLEAIGERAKQCCAQFGVDKTTRDLLEVYEQVLAEQ